jgi:hypothetical protein
MLRRAGRIMTKRLVVLLSYFVKSVWVSMRRRERGEVGY